MKSRLKKFFELGDKSYHAFVSYCELDTTEHPIILELIQILESNSCNVYDVEIEQIPGQSTLRNFIKDGIQQSKMSILFITKRFLSSGMCSFRTSHSVLNYITSRGKHRVIPIILEPIQKLPRDLKVFNCVHLWKYQVPDQRNSLQKTYREVVKKRLLKVVLEAPPKFRRISWRGIKTLTWNKHFLEMVKWSKRKENSLQQVASSYQPINIIKFIRSLNQCVLSCNSYHCSFACNGLDYGKFLRHINTCRYSYEICPNKGCAVKEPRWRLLEHRENCKFTRLKCQYVGCKENILKSHLKNHEQTCKYRVVLCPNHQFGCQKRLNQASVKKHSKVCPFELFVCSQCNMTMFRKDQASHKSTCIKAPMFCPDCKKQINREEEYNHLLECPKTVLACQSVGCNETVERYKMDDHIKYKCKFTIVKCENSGRGCPRFDKKFEIEGHEKKCVYGLTICDNCGKTILKKSAKNHKRYCSAEFVCQLCRTVIKRTEKQNHEQTCPAFVLDCEIYSGFGKDHNAEDKSDCLEKEMEDTALTASQIQRDMMGVCNKTDTKATTDISVFTASACDIENENEPLAVLRPSGSSRGQRTSSSGSDKDDNENTLGLILAAQSGRNLSLNRTRGSRMNNDEKHISSPTVSRARDRFRRILSGGFSNPSTDEFGRQDRLSRKISQLGND